MSRLRLATFAALIGSLAVFAAAAAPPEGKGGQGRGENASAIVTVLTQAIEEDPPLAGIFSDLEADPTTPSLRYYSTELEGQPDPDAIGSDLADGDCIVAGVPAQDGVDNGKLFFFVPFGPSSCTEPRLRALEFRNPGFDFDNDDIPLSPGAPSIELPFGRFGCNDVFPNDPPNPGVTTTSCNYEVRVYDERDEFERTWIIEWANVDVRHFEDPDLKQIQATTAQIFELAVPDNRRNGKKQKIEVISPEGGTDLAFRFNIRRM